MKKCFKKIVLKINRTRTSNNVFFFLCMTVLLSIIMTFIVVLNYRGVSYQFFQSPANISATFYNVLSPFIAIVAAALTFMAFLMQYRANKEMFSNYEDQRKNNAKQEFEHQFYEMLRIHKENVKELKWDQWSISESSSPDFVSEKESFIDGKFYFNNKYAFKQITGRKVFFYHEFEYCFIEYCLRDAFAIVQRLEGLNYDFKRLDDYVEFVKISYSIFYEGQSYIKTIFKGNTSFFDECEKNLNEIERNMMLKKVLILEGLKSLQN